MVPIESLKHEHQTLLAVLQGAEAEAQWISEEGVVRAGPANTLADFFTNFVGRSHHRKEERYLFSRLKESGGAVVGGLIDRLRNEHDGVGGLRDTISGALPRAASGDTESIQIVRA